MNLLVIDTETGGLNAGVDSLLSVAAVVWRSRELIAETQIFVCEPEIRMDEGSFRIHGIEPAWLKRHGVHPREAVAKLEQFVAEHIKQMEPVVLAGHNVGFDVAFLKRLYRLAGADYSKRFSHRTLDTASVGLFLILAQILPAGAASSDELFGCFGIPFGKKERHSALGDARATARMINELLALMDKAQPMAPVLRSGV
jgi:DNA polymerase-3 subunit epsilon